MRFLTGLVRVFLALFLVTVYLHDDCSAQSQKATARRKASKKRKRKGKKRRLARYRNFQGVVRSFSLVDLDNNNKIVSGYKRFNSDRQIDINSLPAGNFSILAHTYPRRVGNVLFKFDRLEVVRSKLPYLLNDPRNDDYQLWRPAAGTYLLSAVPFHQMGERRLEGKGLEVKLQIINETVNPTPNPTITPKPTVQPSATPATTPKPSNSPTPEPSVTPRPPVGQTALSAVWVNDGGDKVAQGELRASRSGSSSVLNSVWDGSRIELFSARNEVVSFNLVLEADSQRASGVKVVVDHLVGPQGKQISSYQSSGGNVFNYVDRNIELFYVRYLQIKGLSRLGYESYDERHVPERFRRPHSGPEAWGNWQDRPDAEKYYPDIAVPIEAVGEFAVERGRSQSIWVDIYVPKNYPAGIYRGNLYVIEGQSTTHEIPIELTVKAFTLPDRPAAKTMLYLGYEDINKRYLGFTYPADSSQDALAVKVRDKHFQLAHRHKISLIDGNPGYGSWQQDRPRDDWQPRLSGALFTPSQGYDGPGVGVGNDVFSIGTYGSWNWSSDSEMRYRADNWVNWFQNNAPGSEYFLYLIDEVYDFARINNWAEVLNNSSGPGRNLMSFATISATAAAENAPTLDIACSTGGLGNPSRWQSAANYYSSRSDKQFCFYNGRRPMTGSFMIEDDGVALRQLAWSQFKMQVHRWFYWESTYYNNFQGGTGETDLFTQAHTFGGRSGSDPVLGVTGWNYSNGDGVLFYPGTDHLNPQNSYGLQGPIASLRLKHWRRGIQDVDYLALAQQIDAGRTAEILNRLIPKVLWEYGVNDPGDPTWVLTDISWPTDPDKWEEARKSLADLIAGSGRFN